MYALGHERRPAFDGLDMVGGPPPKSSGDLVPPDQSRRARARTASTARSSEAWADFPGIRLALAGFGVVLVVGTLGYLALGFGLLDAIYQTVTTVTTVGFREVEPLEPPPARCSPSS